MPARLAQDSTTLAEFMGLLVGCPLHGGNPKECQLHHVRSLALHQRYEWAKGVHLDEAMLIRQRCRACLAHQKARWGIG